MQIASPGQVSLSPGQASEQKPPSAVAKQPARGPSAPQSSPGLQGLPIEPASAAPAAAWRIVQRERNTNPPASSGRSKTKPVGAPASRRAPPQVEVTAPPPPPPPPTAPPPPPPPAASLSPL